MKARTEARWPFLRQARTVGSSSLGRILFAGGFALLTSAPPVAAADFYVNVLGDAPDWILDGVCETGPATGFCTLRAAVQEAEAQGADDAIFLPAGTILVQSPLPTLEASAGRLSISGAGLRLTTISGSNLTLGLIASVGWLSLRSLEIRDFQGTAISSFPGSTLVVERCSFYSNETADHGASIRTTGALTVRDTAFANGSTFNGAGGEIFVSRGPFLCDGCIFENASASFGGALWVETALGTVARVQNSLFWGNVALVAGGAIVVSGDGELDIANSTFSGNRAGRDGGAIRVVSGAIRLFSSTVTGNTADSDLDGLGEGGGIFFDDPGSALFNSILSGNTGSITIEPAGNVWAWPQECAGPVQSNGYNILRSNDEALCVVSGPPPLVLDPMLQPAAYHGGSTRTFPISPGSPAIDGGDPGGCADGLGGWLAGDQRGATRPWGNACDLGAFEYGGLIFDDDFELWEWKWSATSF